MTTWLDEPREVRSGEELETAKLATYLAEHLPEAEGKKPEVEQFLGGFSNLTYLVRWVDLELVLRRPPFGNRVTGAHDMGREYRVLERLHRVYPPAPRPYLYCEDEEILGAPFYLMERRRGIILRRELPSGLVLSPVLAERLCGAFVDNLVGLHALDVEASGLADLGKGEGYVERQVLGWTKRYEKARTDDWPELESVATWLGDHHPLESETALIHNDYKYDNLVLDPSDLTRIVAVLDWEMATIGDPLMDLGSSLAYWTEASDEPAWRAAGFGPTHVEGSYTRRQVVERYAEQSGRDVSGMTFYFAFGLFKLAVIAQQIYYRYAEGHTKDKRFAKMNKMVGLLGRIGAGVIERDGV